MSESEQKRAKAVQRVAEIVAGTVTMWLLEGWFFMLAVGIVHAQWFPAVPTLGFWSALAIRVLLLRVPMLRRKVMS